MTAPPVLPVQNPSPCAAPSIVDHLTLWIAAAVTAGLLQLALARALQLGFSVTRWGWESRDLLWRTPVGYTMLFLPVALCLMVLSLLAPSRVTLRGVVWVWLTLILFALLLLLPQINGYASLLLATAVAMNVSPLVRQRQTGVLRGIRWLAVCGAVVVVLAIVLGPLSRPARERQAIAALPATPAGAPNILLLILDTVGADFTSLDGGEWDTTPNLARRAAQATVFTAAYATSSWTTPSHASFFTGQYPSIHEASFTTPLAAPHRTLAESLQEHGWATAGVTANLMATPSESGLAQGFIHYDDLQNSAEEILKSTTLTQADNVLRAWDALVQGQGIRTAISRFWSTDFTPRLTENTHDLKTAEEVREQFTTWLDGVPGDRPFFAFLNFFDAHAPYQSPEPYHSMFAGPRPTMQHHAGGIRYIDAQVELLLLDLEQRGKLANTIVVVTSDHGEQFGEHGLDAHANSLYRQVIQVPLMVIFPPAVPAGQRIDRQVTGRDIPATILDLAGVPQDSGIGGTSLAELWRDSTAVVSEVIAAIDQNTRPVERFRNWLGPMKALVNDTLHVIRDGAGLYEAYRYRLDPAETRDLVAASGDATPFADLLQASVARNRLTWPTAVPPVRRPGASGTGTP